MQEIDKQNVIDIRQIPCKGPSPNRERIFSFVGGLFPNLWQAVLFVTVCWWFVNIFRQLEFIKTKRWIVANLPQANDKQSKFVHKHENSSGVEVSSAFVTHKSGICKQDKGKGEILLFREKKDFETEIVVGNCGSQEKVIFGREIIYFLSPETPLSHAVKFEEEKRIKALWKRRIVFYRRGMQRRGGEKSIPLKSPHSTSFGLTHIL